MKTMMMTTTTLLFAPEQWVPADDHKNERKANQRGSDKKS
jgi:hypothetical protein